MNRKSFLKTLLVAPLSTYAIINVFADNYNIGAAKKYNTSEHLYYKSIKEYGDEITGMHIRNCYLTRKRGYLYVTPQDRNFTFNVKVTYKSNNCYIEEKVEFEPMFKEYQ